MKDVVPDHHVQMQIFNQLVTAELLRFSDLKPKGMESNAFMYHLNFLQKQGLVEKVPGGYSLTFVGKATAARYSLREKGIRIMPSAISVVILRAKDGEMLLYERARQPYIGAIGFASGKIHLGDTLEAAAYRELAEKCDYTRSEVKLVNRGVFGLVQRSEGALTNHIVGHVWVGEVMDKKTYANHAGKTFWAKWPGPDTGKLMLGTSELVEALKSPDFFHLDLSFDL
jgi:ADP-ribose pyrophosphatase YjhB (NUDIX family)